ncbi:MAG TPA: hypothetical protein VK843_18130 [Planctomycetota bacterium]|nr:hypothetical protein [Planctomycetota bacterium]
MIAIAYVALFAIPLLAAVMILTYRGSTRVVAIALIGGWLAMPLLRVTYVGLPTMDKESMLAFSILLATWLARLGSYPPVKLRWFDLPVIVLCLAPIASSLSNHLGLYDGVSRAVRQTFIWGAPYAIGRMICVDRASLMVIGRVLLMGVVCYTPLCLLESRLAPQLHQWIYGIPGRVGWENVGFYGPLKWKPTVFLQSALELTPLMGMGFLFGWWMLYRRRLARVGMFTMTQLAVIALVATLMGKSLGGVTLTFAGVCVLYLGHRFQTRAFLIALMALAPLYAITRTTGMWNGRALVEFIAENVSARRSASLDYRMANEDILVAKALEQPTFGWGGWGRNRVYDEEGRDRSVTDGQWVITFGTDGLVGLISWLGILLVPAWLIVTRYSSRTAWTDPQNAILQLGAVVLALHSIDCLANAMPSPIYYLIAGGLCSVLHNERQPRRTSGRKGSQLQNRSEKPAATATSLRLV